MIKKIALIACVTVAYTGSSRAMENVVPEAPAISFIGKLPDIPDINIKVGGGSSNVPIEHIISVSPGTLFAVAGLLGLYQTASLLKEGIQKYSDPDSIKQAEGKRILCYSSILLAGSAMAILSKLLPFLK